MFSFYKAHSNKYKVYTLNPIKATKREIGEPLLN